MSAAPLVASTSEACRAEWCASPALQAEFQRVDDYVALRKAETADRAKEISKAPIPLDSVDAAVAWRAEFSAAAALQAEFASVDDYLALRKAEAAGRADLRHL